MIVLIEGIDGTGKTTLARAVAERAGMRYWKSSFVPTQGDELAQQHDLAVLQTMIASDVDWVIDRMFVSEYVYDSFYGREFDRELVFEMDEMLRRSAHVAWLLYFEKRAFQDGTVSRRQTDAEVAVDDLEQLQGRFHEYVERGTRPQTWLNWNRLNAEKTTNDMVQHVMHSIAHDRPSKDDTFMRMARDASRRSTCLARRIGAVLVSADGHVIATGYNGPPRGHGHPSRCARLDRDYESGANLDACPDVHAEENCIAQAANGGHNVKGATIYTTHSPCLRCGRMLINAGVNEIVFGEKYGDDRIFGSSCYGIVFRKAGM